MKALTKSVVSNKTVLLRVDFNVPMFNGRIVDDSKIVASLPTILWLKENGAKTILCSHLGRPDGKRKRTLTVEKIRLYLESLIKVPVAKGFGPTGTKTVNIIKRMGPSELCLLENVRFDKGEETNDDSFARNLSDHIDVYINDAFGTTHRAHASIEAITKYLPAYPGFLMQKEIKSLNEVVTTPKKPFIAILGGAKIGDKIRVIENLSVLCDSILIGGGMITAFLIASKKMINSTLIEKKEVNIANRILKSCQNIELPPDVITSKTISQASIGTLKSDDDLASDDLIVDIGPKTIERYKMIIDKSNTILWNGPLGVYEYPNFSNGSYEIGKSIARSKAATVAGGGSTSDLINKANLVERFTHVSTGGGATLKFLEGGSLPGLVALER
jgi:phosphoglycerate kinase